MTLHHTCSPQPSVDASCTPPASTVFKQSSRCSSSNSMASESPFSPVPLQLRTTSSVSSTIISSANPPSKSNPLNSYQGHTTLSSRMLLNNTSFLEDEEDDIKDVRSSEDQGDVRNSNFSYFDSFCTTLRSNSLLHSSPPSPLPSPNSSPFTSPLNRAEDESPISSCESSPYGAKVFRHSQLPKFRPLFASDINHAFRSHD